MERPKQMQQDPKSSKAKRLNNKLKMRSIISSLMTSVGVNYMIFYLNLHLMKHIRRGNMANLFSSFKNPRALLAFFYDMIVASLAFWGALFLRFDSLNLPLIENLTFNRFFFISMFIHAGSFVLGGLYKGVWRFSSMYDLIRVVKASATAIVISLVVCSFLLFISTLSFADVAKLKYSTDFLLEKVLEKKNLKKRSDIPLPVFFYASNTSLVQFQDAIEK